MAGAGAGAKKRDTGGARAEEKKFRLHNTRKKDKCKKKQNIYCQFAWLFRNLYMKKVSD